MKDVISFTALFALVLSLTALPGTVHAGDEKPELGKNVELVDEAGSSWGTLKGRVLLKGDVPDPKTFKTNKRFKKTCNMKKNRTVQRVNVKDGGIQNVFVYLKGVKKALKPELPEKTLVIDQKECRFLPRIGLVQANGTVRVKNSDPTIHNFFYRGTAALGGVKGNKMQPKGADPLSVGVKSAEFITYRCNVHPWMKGMVRVANHHAYTLTAKNGSFSLTVPPGEYKMVVHHITMKEPISTSVTVPEKASVKKSLKLNLSK